MGFGAFQRGIKSLWSVLITNLRALEMALCDSPAGQYRKSDLGWIGYEALVQFANLGYPFVFPNKILPKSTDRKNTVAECPCSHIWEYFDEQLVG